jgi:hypothetical protein
MRKVIVLSLMALLVLTVSDLSSQTKQNFAKKNTWEVGGSISYSNVTAVNNGETGDAVNTFTFEPYGGYFVVDGFEIGLIPAVQYISYDDDNYTSFAIYLAPAYNFYTKSMVYPYIQGAIGYNSISGSGMDTRTGVAWDLEGGLKLNVYGNSLLKIGLDYGQQTLNTSSDTGDRDGFNSFRFVAGFNVFFK